MMRRATVGIQSSLWITVVVLSWITGVWMEYRASSPCTIVQARNPQKNLDLRGKRVRCRSKALTSLAKFRPSTFPVNTIQLDLSSNVITYLKKDALKNLSKLQRLELQNNHISSIEPGAFNGLESLVKLDLSDNRLGSINSSVFTGMPKLEKLLLSRNQLKGLPDGAFDGLPLLKRIDLQSAYLMCDCHLQWVVKWAKMNNVRIQESTKCAIPKGLRGRPLKTLKKKDLHCNWPLELPVFQITPHTSQVVFEGDKLPFECRASVNDPDTKMIWVRGGSPVHSNKSAGIHVKDTQFSHDHTIMIKRLVLEHLQVRNSGIWKCQVLTPRGNVSRNVNIIVISEDTLYCDSVVTRTNKGVFTWPKTVSGITVDLVCPMGRAAGYMGQEIPRAFYKCNDNGRWEDLETSQCQYKSEMTRVLEQYTKTDISNLTNVVKRAKKLKTYIASAKAITDKMDVVYTSRIVQSLSQHVKNNNQLGDMMLHIVSIMMNVDEKLLQDAQFEDGACSRMVKAIEEIPRQLLRTKKAVAKYADNIALVGHEVEPDGFSGMTCTAYGTGRWNDIYLQSSFQCTANSNNTTPVSPDKDRKVEASIRVPGSVFRVGQCNTGSCQQAKNFRLQFIVYKNGKLFRDLSEENTDRTVTTSVVSSRIDGMLVENLTDPVVVHLMARFAHRDSFAVYWDFDAEGGRGGWRTRGCSIQSAQGNLSTIHCNHLTNFALIQTVVTPGGGVLFWLHSFFMMEPIVYTGSTICILCMLAIVITYITCHRFIKIPRKAKHSLVNTCISIMFLCITFTFGVNRTESSLACQIVGIAVHYFSVCTVFWITITSSNMHKKFTKAERPPTPPPDSLTGPLPPKPMLRFYLLGWGVAIIICGITAAVNIQHYAGHTYCFLAWEPSLGAFYGPVSLLVFINCIFFLCISCVLRGSSNHIEEPETEEINDIELSNQELESLAHTNNTNHENDSDSSIMDLEYRPISQLRAVALVLFLYLLVWCSGAFAVAQPLGLVPYQSLIFSYLYGVTSTGLGIFMLIFYCLARHDARACWRRFFCCVHQSRNHQHPHPHQTVYDTSINASNHMAHANGHIVQSASSLDSSYKSSNTNRSFPVKNGTKKQSNVNLVPSLTATVTDRSMSSIQENFPSFYNPRQNGVAKKFWEKSRQHQRVKLLNKEINVENHSGHNSVTDRGGGSDTGHNKRHSFGNGSDTNTHLSIEIQIQSRPSSNGIPGQVDPIKHYNNLAKNQNGGYHGQSPLAIQVGQPPVPMLDQNQLIPIGCHPSAGSAFVPVQKRDVPVMPQYVPPLIPPRNSGEFSYLPPPLLPTTINCSENNTLPKQKKGDGTNAISQYMQRNGSVPRLRDFDGQSQVSQEQKSQPSNSDNHKVEQFMPLDPPPTCRSSKHFSPDSDSQSGCRNIMNSSFEQGCGFKDKPPPGDSGRNSKRRKKRNSFLDQLEQRIPPNNRPLSPARSDSGPHTHHDRHTSYGESDNQSDSNNHKRRHRSHDGHRRRNKRQSHSLPKPRSANWEEQIRNRPSKASYAYVNHDYQEKVFNKLLKNSQTDEGSDPLTKAFWMPRSVSAYEQVANDVLDNLEDDSSSSDDSADDDIWVLQKNKKKKFKKETSV